MAALKINRGDETYPYDQGRLFCENYIYWDIFIPLCLETYLKETYSSFYYARVKC